MSGKGKKEKKEKERVREDDGKMESKEEKIVKV